MSIEYSQQSIDFLDLTNSKDEDGLVHTNIFRKKTSCNTILRADSFHPPHLKNNIPYGQFQQLHRICDREEVSEEQANIMSKRFKDRACKPAVIAQARDRAHSLNRTDLLSKTARHTHSQSRTFVTKYSTHAEHIKSIVKSN